MSNTAVMMVESDSDIDFPASNSDDDDDDDDDDDSDMFHDALSTKPVMTNAKRNINSTYDPHRLNNSRMSDRYCMMMMEMMMEIVMYA